MIGLNVTAMVAIAIVAWDGFKADGILPPPQKFMWIAFVWAVLGFIGEAGAPQIAAVFGFGLVLAMAYHYLGSGTVPKKGRIIPNPNPDATSQSAQTGTSNA